MLVERQSPWILNMRDRIEKDPSWEADSHSGSQEILCLLWNKSSKLMTSHRSLWLPLWFSGQSSWQQIQRSGYDSWRYQIFWEVVGLERGPLSLVGTIEEILERKSSSSGLESREYGHRDPPCWPCDTFCPQKLALTSLTSGGRLVGIVRLRTKTIKFSFFIDTHSKPNESIPHILKQFFDIHISSILSYTPLSPKWYLPFRIPDQNFACICSS
jgi:hypothetical protein